MLLCIKSGGLKHTTASLIGTYLTTHQRQVFSYVLLDFACTLRNPGHTLAGMQIYHIQGNPQQCQQA